MGCLPEMEVPPCFHTSRGVTQPIRREIPHKLDTSTRWEWSAVAGERRRGMPISEQDEEFHNLNKGRNI
jgi:hypothetical protein